MSFFVCLVFCVLINNSFPCFPEELNSWYNQVIYQWIFFPISWQHTIWTSFSAAFEADHTVAYLQCCPRRVSALSYVRLFPKFHDFLFSTSLFYRPYPDSFLQKVPEKCVFETLTKFFFFFFISHCLAFFFFKTF